jgi:nitric oxide reductase NorD protein
MKEALQEVGLGTVVRTPEAPRNLVRAEVIAEPTGLEVGQGSAVALGAFRYPEWDARRGRYRPDWCTVRELRYLSGDAGADNLAVSNDILRAERRHVDAIRGHLLRTLYRRRVRSRQTEGPEIDVEAMVERHADLAVGRTPPDRLYRAARRTLKEVAVLILLDASWSTDAYLEGRRVLDIELSSLLVVAEAFEGYLEEEVAVASFCSHTRNDVRFGVLKSFTDPWIHLRQIAPSLRPDGYTRIGAAVRHASAVLETARAPQKLLLLLSDGKPTDYDRYEGKHGIQDVRHAVREANERRIHTFGIAVEKEAKLYLARMLGPGHHRILNRPDVLPDVMAEVLLRAASS